MGVEQRLTPFLPQQFAAIKKRVVKDSIFVGIYIEGALVNELKCKTIHDTTIDF